MNPLYQGGGVRHSGATPNDENADRGDSGQQDMQFICEQFLRIYFQSR